MIGGRRGQMTIRSKEIITQAAVGIISGIIGAAIAIVVYVAFF